jgi:hypothetical protein
VTIEKNPNNVGKFTASDQLVEMSDTHSLGAAARGKADSVEDLLPLVYEELRCLAGARTAQKEPGETLRATPLIHDAWLQLVNDGASLALPRGFFAAAAESMRRTLIECAHGACVALSVAAVRRSGVSKTWNWLRLCLDPNWTNEHRSSARESHFL